MKNKTLIFPLITFFFNLTYPFCVCAIHTDSGSVSPFSAKYLPWQFYSSLLSLDLVN